MFFLCWDEDEFTLRSQDGFIFISLSKLDFIS